MRRPINFVVETYRNQLWHDLTKINNCTQARKVPSGFLSSSMSSVVVEIMSYLPKFPLQPLQGGQRPDVRSSWEVQLIWLDPAFLDVQRLVDCVKCICTLKDGNRARA